MKKTKKELLPINVWEEKKLGVMALPDDIIRFVDVNNWEDMWDEYMVVDIFNEKTKKIEGKDYVWNDNVVKDFIREILRKLKEQNIIINCKEDVKPKRATKRNK
jgi:hypothetical protein